MSIRFINSRTTLGVADVARSLRFYVDQLGFRVETTMGEPPSFALLIRDDTSLALVQAEEPAVATFACCYINMVGVEELHQRWTEAGFKVAHPLTRHPWGNYDFVVQDPDGHQIALGESHATDH